MKIQIPIVLATMLLFTSTAFGQRETFFETAFEYADEPFILEDSEPSELDGATGQIGNWVGDPFPAGVGDIFDLGCPGTDGTCDVVGFRDNPWDGTRLLILDRATGDTTRPNADASGNFKGAFSASLTTPISNLGAEIAFDLGVFRTTGNHQKDFDIVGRGSDGAESFRVRVGTNNNGAERLGVVSDNGASELFDLPTAVGEDRPADLNNMGASAAEGGVFAVGDEFPRITLRLGAGGFTIDLASPPENTSGEANAYISETLPYNGAAADLAQIDFGYSASSSNGFNSGYALDNILVTGFETFLQGDFDLDGTLGFPDFLILTSNFGQQSSDGDFDLNGTVDLADFVGFKAAFGAQAPTAASVPEPTSIGLLLIGVLGFLARRRRR